jgi:hypothetical protein
MAVIYRYGSFETLSNWYFDAIDWLSDNIEQYDRHIYTYKPLPYDGESMVAEWTKALDTLNALRPASYPTYARLADDIRQCTAKSWHCLCVREPWTSLASGNKDTKSELMIEVSDDLIAIQLVLML